MSAPSILALAGLPGTGKSTLARGLARALSAPLLDKDVLRSALFAPAAIEHSREQDDLVVDCLYRVAEFHLRRGRPWVVLDGRTYSRRDQVAALRALAARSAARLVLIECVAAPATVRARLAADRARGRHPAADRGPELYDRLRAAAEPIEGPKWVLDTDRSTPERLLSEVLERLAGGPEAPPARPGGA